MVEDKQENQVSCAGTVLERIGLTAQEIATLRQQGSVCVETRGRNSSIYKLRFRMDGFQRMRYLGTDAAFAAAVREELKSLRRVQDSAKKLRSLKRDAHKLLRQSKSRSIDALEPMGYAFHGFDIRRRRDA